MGLDMFAYRTKRDIPDVDDTTDDPEDEEIFYWRKHPNLHGWMRSLYIKKGGKDEEFNLSTVKLTLKDIESLQKDVEEDKLPETSGFFFGASSAEDMLEDLKFIQDAKEAIQQGYNIYYYAWW